MQCICLVCFTSDLIHALNALCFKSVYLKWEYLHMKHEDRSKVVK